MLLLLPFCRFKQMVHDIAFSALERQFQVKLDKTNIKIPKMKYKGNPTATVMRWEKIGEKFLCRLVERDFRLYSDAVFPKLQLLL